MFTMFRLVDAYLGLRLGAELSTAPQDHVAVVESPRRLTAELSYGYVHALWWLRLADGRSVISAPPGAGTAVSHAVSAVRDEGAMACPEIAAALRAIVDASRKRANLPRTNRVLHSLLFACNRQTLRPQPLSICRRLEDASIPAADGLTLPTHCFPHGTVYGVVVDGRVVSVAYAHRTGAIQDEVADIGVETAEGYRRRGYARAAVSAVVSDYVRRGGEAVYGCAPANGASVATATSVGFIPYAKSMVLAAPS
jgi:hypothetical protein